jgi:hypothetical protein
MVDVLQEPTSKPTALHGQQVLGAGIRSVEVRGSKWNNCIPLALSCLVTGAENTAMPTRAERLLEKRIEDADREIASLRLRVEQQLVHLDELVGQPHEAKKARATFDRRLEKLSRLQHQRLSLYRQAAASGVRGPKRRRSGTCGMRAYGKPTHRYFL